MSQLVPPIQSEIRRHAIQRCREKQIILPTFEQLRNPHRLPSNILEKLKKIKLSEINPLNLFRITWKNDMASGLFDRVNYLEIPSEISGVKARIIGLIGKHFPTGSHKVGAAYGCLVPKLVSGHFDPIHHTAIWPSTGNYCRGGVFDCALLGCHSTAVLPEQMSKERFEWLKQYNAEVISTPGGESNVKALFDTCKQLETNTSNVIFNQFQEFGNSMFHYHLTGHALYEAYEDSIKTPHSQAAAFVCATGSAGTIAAGDYLKRHYPNLKIVAAEALQCPTLLMNGFGTHRIEGIGDKHVPWIYNVRNTDAIAAIDDEDCLRLMRLFNEKKGTKYLKTNHIPKEMIQALPLLGISSICNILAAIKTAKYFEMTENDIILTCFTDSMELYGSRLTEQNDIKGNYSTEQAAQDFSACLQHQSIDYFKPLSYEARKRIHNLKYYTWIEQHNKTVDELDALWDPIFWHQLFDTEIEHLDQLITEFNEETG